MSVMDGMLTQKEVCEWLGISPKKLQLLRVAGKIPFTRFGHRTIRFKSRDVWHYLYSVELETRPPQKPRTRFERELDGWIINRGADLNG